LNIASATPAHAGPPQIDAEYLNTLIQCSPHCGALGLRAGVQGPGGLSLLMPARPFMALAPGGEVWHPGAIGSALDNVLSMGAMAVIAPDSRPATIDLRWDMVRDARLVDLRLTAAFAQVTPQLVYVHGEMAEADTGAVFGRASACVAYAPPQESGRYQVRADPPSPSDATAFAEWLGIGETGPGVAAVPYRVELTGAAGIPFWHGGALIASMTAAAQAQAQRLAPGSRLLTATASFDIFATELPLELDATDACATRTRASVYVACSQAGRGVTSRLAAHFGRPRG